ncbi:FG-GAP repeat protein [Stackebrandtia nassauensis]|uniref:FG-GAP repeat protein n=1 Tax=Stackebrandtia nassauensis TaxID=283811 RepID=UPI001FCC3B60|nr:integrin [Stackebrandtia nassauensis]
MALVQAAGPASAGEFVADPINDFDCDGQRDALDADSAASVGGHDAAGAVRVQYSGTAAAITIDQSTPGIAGSPETEDQFGTEVTAYDENGDGCDDLVIGASYEDLVDEGGEEQADAGMIWMIPGSAAGLDTQASTSLNLNSPGVPGSIAEYQWFGRTLSSGETQGGEPYLVAASPGYRTGSTQWAAGAVYYLRGDETYRITQDSPGVPGTAESYDYFGERIAVTDRYVAISAPGESIGSKSNAGMVHVFDHNLQGGVLTTVGAFHQDSPGISGTTETGDLFGDGLAVIGYRASASAPVSALVSAGSPGEAIGSSGGYTGMAHLIRVSSVNDLAQVSSVHQDSPGVLDVAEFNDGFGADTALATSKDDGIGSPATTHWAVEAWEFEDDGQGGENDNPQVHVFANLTDPGDGDRLIAGNDYGLPLASTPVIRSLDASDTYLYLTIPTDPTAVYGVPWQNILGGGSEETVIHRVDPW